MPWSGGGGAGPHGNEATGSIQSLVAPQYQARSNGILSDSEAWIKAGTGTIDVTRSFVGSNAGNQGNGWFVTAAASARLDVHEQLHVNSTQSIYNTFIAPLLARVTAHTATAAGGYSLTLGRTNNAAIDALRNQIGWANAVSQFQNTDRVTNNPGGPTDNNDVASGTYVVDGGPGVVGGVNFAHILRMPTEPNPP